MAFTYNYQDRERLHNRTRAVKSMQLRSSDDRPYLLCGDRAEGRDPVRKGFDEAGQEIKSGSDREKAIRIRKRRRMQLPKVEAWCLRRASPLGSDTWSSGPSPGPDLAGL